MTWYTIQYSWTSYRTGRTMRSSVRVDAPTREDAVKLVMQGKVFVGVTGPDNGKVRAW